MRLRYLWSFVIVLLAGWATSASAAPPAAAPMTRDQAKAMFAAATRQTGHFSEGSGAPLYVYFDPDCIYCHLLYERIRPYVHQGRVHVTWIPVAILKSDGPGKAEAILAARDPVAALRLNERHFNTQDEEGGIAPLKHVPTAVAREVYQNTRLLAALGEVATPTLVFADRKGVIHILLGMPPHLAPVIDSLGPLPGAS
ncbi:MAG: thioredoxin fold domain-containing protein [Acidiferrobacteraceae bacterium]